MGGFRLGRILGLEITIDFSWLIILALVVWSFSAGVFPSVAPELSSGTHLAMGVAASLLFFSSLLVHEIAHSLTARSKGVEVEAITLFIFGGVSRMRDEAESPRDEFLIAAAGPLASIVIAAVFWAIHAAGSAAGWGSVVSEVARYLAFLNLLLAGFNLLPGFPLDGGRLFRALVWGWKGDLETATRWATAGGQLLGMLIAALGLVQLFGGNLVGGLWLGFIGWFLASAAKTSYRQHVLRAALEGVTAADAMTPDPDVVAPSLTVAELVENHFLRAKHGSFPVVEEGQPVGLITLEETGKIPRDRWGEVHVREVMLPFGEELAVRPGEGLIEVIGKMGQSPGRRLLVVGESGSLEGIVTARDVTAWLALRTTQQAPEAESLAGGAAP